MSTDLNLLSPTQTQTAILAWHLALDITAAKALDAYPTEAKRIQGGVKLVQQRAVTLHANGTATVASRSRAGQVYTVNGTCQCDAIAWATERGDGSYNCAHRWAKTLYKRALEQLTKLSCATYDGIEGFVVALPEDSGWGFFASWTGAFRVIPGTHADLVLHGRCAWLEHGTLVGMVPQAALDMA